MYTEKKAGEKIKNAAQGLFTFATYGLGMFIGTWFSGFTADHYISNGEHLWKKYMARSGLHSGRSFSLFYFVF